MFKDNGKPCGNEGNCSIWYNRPLCFYYENIDYLSFKITEKTLTFGVNCEFLVSPTEASGPSPGMAASCCFSLVIRAITRDQLQRK